MTTPPVPDPGLWATNPSQAAAEDAALDAQTTADFAPTAEQVEIGTAENVIADALPVVGALAAATDPTLAPAAIAGATVGAAALKATKDAQAADANATAAAITSIAQTVVTTEAATITPSKVTP